MTDMRIDEIVIPERHRKDMGNIDALAASIADVGLLQPIVIRPDNTLVAGQRRLAACRQLGWDCVPVYVTRDLEDELRMLRAERDENTCRKDFTPTEAVTIGRAVEPLEREAARERQEATQLAGKDANGQPCFGGENFTPPNGGKALDKVAEVVGMSRPTYVKAKTVTEAAETNPEEFGDLPEMMDAKSIEAAHKEMRKRQRIAEMAARLQQDPNTPTIVQLDALAFLQQIPLASVDLLLTDPPYMTDLEDVVAFAREWVPAAMARVKPSGRAYIFTGPYPLELHSYLSVLMAVQEFTIGNVMVWTYRNTMGPSPKMVYKNNWQACFYLYGDDAPPLDCLCLMEKFSVQDFPAPHQDALHAWQKPDGLAERLVLHSTRPNDSIIDPFAGTGTFLIAAAKLGRRARGADISPEMIAIAERRGCRRE